MFKIADIQLTVQKVYHRTNNFYSSRACCHTENHKSHSRDLIAECIDQQLMISSIYLFRFFMHLKLGVNGVKLSFLKLQLKCVVLSNNLFKLLK
jgi:hypothetical protein